MLTSDPLVIRVHQAFRAGRRRANPGPFPPPPSQRVYQPDPFAEKPEPKPSRVRRRAFRGPAPAARPMYLMQDHAPDAPAWVVLCAATGVALGRVRGDALWAMRQAGLLAASQGEPLTAVRVRRAG